jgi:hypothetical protein
MLHDLTCQDKKLGTRSRLTLSTVVPSRCPRTTPHVVIVEALRDGRARVADGVADRVERGPRFDVASDEALAYGLVDLPRGRQSPRGYTRPRALPPAQNLTPEQRQRVGRSDDDGWRRSLLLGRRRR